MNHFIALSLFILGFSLAPTKSMAQQEIAEPDGTVIFIPATPTIPVEQPEPPSIVAECPAWGCDGPPSAQPVYAPVATPNPQPMPEQVQQTPCENEVMGVCIDSVIGTGIGGYAFLQPSIPPPPETPEPITICSDLAILNPDGTTTGGACITETWQPVPYAAQSSESVAQDNQIAPAAPGSIGAVDSGSNF